MIPSYPRVKPKFKTGLVNGPVNVTVGLEPDTKDDTEPIEKLGVAPSKPLSSPKFNIGFTVVPVIETVLIVPGSKLDTQPIDKLGVKPVCPTTPTVLNIAVILIKPPPVPPKVLNVHVSPIANAQDSPVTIFEF